MRDLVLVASMVLLFATLVTVHVLIALGLASRGRRRDALLALVLVPVAPFFAWREHMRARAAIWAGAAALYVAVRVVASLAP